MTSQSLQLGFNPISSLVFNLVLKLPLFSLEYPRCYKIPSPLPIKICKLPSFKKKKASKNIVSLYSFVTTVSNTQTKYIINSQAQCVIKDCRLSFTCKFYQLLKKHIIPILYKLCQTLDKEVKLLFSLQC